MNLRRAVAGLRELLEYVTLSSVWESLPENNDPVQPKFLNACAVGMTHLTPRQVLHSLHDLEYLLGRRRRGVRGEPRIIDLDLLLYDAQVIHEPDLQVPHPRMCVRPFVLIPLAQIAGDWVVPKKGRSSFPTTIAALARRVSCKGMELTQIEFDDGK